MSGRLVMLVALAAAAVAVTLVVTRADSAHAPQVARASLPPSLASYLGVYEAGPPDNYQQVAQFAKAIGRGPNLVGYYSGWAEPFATSFAVANRNRGAVTVVQIDPTFTSISAIAAGSYDSYLRSYADSVRDFGHPVVVGFGHEMNGTWYSWGYGHVPPSTFVAAWQHLVTLFHSEGADNAAWMWTINSNVANTSPLGSWWPGNKYVDWVGIDGYYARPSDTFANVFGPTIDQVRSFTNKPVLLSETAIGPSAGQVAKMGDLFHGMHKYNTLGLIWFDIAQHQGLYHQDWRIEDNLAAQAAFRLGVTGMTLARL